MISWVLMFVFAASPSDGIESEISQIDRALSSIEAPKKSLPHEIVELALVRILKQLEDVRLKSSQVNSSTLAGRIRSLEARWSDFVVDHLQPSQRELYDLVTAANIREETRDRMAQFIPEFPPHPLRVENFRFSGLVVSKIDLKELSSYDDPNLIWISVPSLDLLDSKGEASDHATAHILYGFDRKDISPDFKGLGSIEIWKPVKEMPRLEVTISEETLRRLESKTFETFSDWVTAATYEVRLDQYSPGERIVRALPGVGKFRAARWDVGFDVDDLVNEKNSLDHMIWLSFVKGPRHHYEPMSVYDPLPHLIERGSFSFLKTISGPPLFWATDREARRLIRQIEEPRPRVIDLLRLASNDQPEKFVDCALFLRSLKRP